MLSNDHKSAFCLQPVLDVNLPLQTGSQNFYLKISCINIISLPLFLKKRGFNIYIKHVQIGIYSQTIIGTKTRKPFNPRLRSTRCFHSNILSIEQDIKKAF